MSMSDMIRSRAMTSTCERWTRHTGRTTVGQLDGSGVKECAEVALFVFQFDSLPDQLIFADEQFVHLAIEVDLLFFQLQLVEYRSLTERMSRVGTAAGSPRWLKRDRCVRADLRNRRVIVAGVVGVCSIALHRRAACHREVSKRDAGVPSVRAETHLRVFFDFGGARDPLMFVETKC